MEPTLIFQPQDQPEDHTCQVFHICNSTHQVQVVSGPQRLRVIQNRSEIFQFPFLHNDVGTPVGRINYSKVNYNLLDIMGVLDAVNSGSLISTQAPHLTRFYNQMRGIEPSVTGENSVTLQSLNG